MGESSAGAMSKMVRQPVSPAQAMRQLPLLEGLEAHSTVILPQVDEGIFRRLKVNLTCDPKYQSHNLYHK